MTTSQRARSRIDSQGRLLIPAEQRRALGIEPGDSVTLEVVDGELRVLTIDEGIRRAQDLVRRFVPAGRRLSDELISDRRDEADRELADER